MMTTKLAVVVDCSSALQVLISDRGNMAELACTLPVLIKCGDRIDLTFEVVATDPSCGIEGGAYVLRVGPVWRGRLHPEDFDAIQAAFGEEAMDDFISDARQAQAESRGVL